MKILAFDTSMAACSAAVGDGGCILSHRFEAMATGQAERLAPMIADVMKEAAMSFGELQRILVTTGPGTFTGVRIGLSMARGFGVSLEVPVVGLDTLAAIACNDPSRDLPLAVVADARNDEFHVAVFDDAPNPRMVRRAELPSVLPQAPFRLLGSGADMIIAQFPQAQRSAAGDLPVARNFMSAAAALDPASHPSDPLYLRQPDIKPQHRIETLTQLGSAGAALLAELHGESFTAGWREEEFAKLFGAPGLAASIVMHGDQPAGFILTRRAADEAEIITICIRPKMRRKGFAKILVQQAVRHARERGIKHLFLEVGADNAAGHALYRSVGFSEAGRRPRYYRDVEDAITMRKGL
jgi:tRNA threonylcarbamoyladenosine biosynthesis protein TsaB